MYIVFMGCKRWVIIVGLCKGRFFSLLNSQVTIITKSKRPDIEPAVAFFTTRVVKINVGDCNKIIIVISYLNQTVDAVRMIGGFNITYLFTWFDASYDVHPNMRIHTVGLMSMVYGILHFRFIKKHMNEKKLLRLNL